MRCAKCKQFFDILCANFVADEYAKLAPDFKRMWICFECRSKIPKHDNSHTPVRQQLNHDISVASDCLDVSMHSSDNITFRNCGMRRVQSSSKTNPAPHSNMAPVVQEIKKLQDDFEARLTSKICSLLTDQFNNFKTLVFDRIGNLNEKINELEEQIKTMERTSSTSTCGNPGASRSYSKLDSEKTKPKVNSGSLRNKSGIARTSKPEVKLSTVVSTSLQQVPTIVSDVNTPTKKEKDDEWIQVKRRQVRSSLPGLLRGTAAPGTTALCASERWKYLHLYYVQEGTTVEQVRAHLNSICENSDCTVDELKSRGRYSSFKLGVPARLADNVMSANNWAEDICVKPWRQNFRAKEKSA
jgi:hypothetical protein